MLRPIALFGINAAMLLLVLWVARLQLNLTDSYPLGVYQAAEPRTDRGTLVSLCLPDEVVSVWQPRGYIGHGGRCGSHMPLMKRIEAIPGDVVRVDRSIRINGQSHGSLMLADAAGRALPPARGGRVGSDELWVLSPTAQDSFDSRYFGPVSPHNLLHSLEPVWTW